jgi:hypothetical protein
LWHCRTTSRICSIPPSSVVPIAARGEALKLSDDELAFYDALETNDSAVKALGDETLRTIARELVAAVRANVTIDWTLRENVRAQLRVLVKRILRKYGYPPDKQEKATGPCWNRQRCCAMRGSLETGRDAEREQAKRRFLDEWVAAVNAHGGFGTWAWDVALEPADVAGALERRGRA